MSTAYQINLSQEVTAKHIYKAIVWILHPDQNCGKEYSPRMDMLLKLANQAKERDDYDTLCEIYDEISGVSVKTEIAPKSEATTLKDFFRSKGLEVIDKRDKGGCLWVVGSPSEIDDIVRAACKKFYAGGNYAMNGGKASGYRTAWFTKCQR